LVYKLFKNPAREESQLRSAIKKITMKTCKKGIAFDGLQEQGINKCIQKKTKAKVNRKLINTPANP